LGWRSNPVKQFGGEVDVGPGTGRYKSSTLMLNGIYDFDLGNAWRPFLGAGLGWLRSSANNIERSLNQGDCCTGIIDGSDNGLAWQLIAGIGYEIDSGTWLTFDYRYLASAGQMQYGYRVGCVPDGSVCLGEPGTTEARYTSQTLAIGVRHSF
jgi:opacity protein-like surface antigen